MYILVTFSRYLNFLNNTTLYIPLKIVKYNINYNEINGSSQNIINECRL